MRGIWSLEVPALPYKRSFMISVVCLRFLTIILGSIKRDNKESVYISKVKLFQPSLQSSFTAINLSVVEPLPLSKALVLISQVPFRLIGLLITRFICLDKTKLYVWVLPWPLTLIGSQTWELLKQEGHLITNRLSKCWWNWTEFVKAPWTFYGTGSNKMWMLWGVFVVRSGSINPNFIKELHRFKHYLLTREGYILVLSRDYHGLSRRGQWDMATGHFNGVSGSLQIVQAFWSLDCLTVERAASGGN